MLSARTRPLSRGRAFRVSFRKPNARNGTQPESRLRMILFTFETRRSVGERNSWKISSFRKAVLILGFSRHSGRQNSDINSIFGNTRKNRGKTLCFNGYFVYPLVDRIYIIGCKLDRLSRNATHNPHTRTFFRTQERRSIILCLLFPKRNRASCGSHRLKNFSYSLRFCPQARLFRCRRSYMMMRYRC